MDFNPTDLGVITMKITGLVIVALFLGILYFDDLMLVFHSSPQKVAISEIKLTPKSNRKVFWYHYQTGERRINGFSSVAPRFEDQIHVGDSVWIEYSTIFDRVSRICETPWVDETTREGQPF